MRNKTNSTADEVITEPVAEVMTTSVFSKGTLAGITSLEDAQHLARAEYGTLANADEDLGDGFRVATEDDKRRLVGIPMFFLEWTFRPGDFGKDYVSIRAVAQESSGVSKWIINDGGTGICQDLKLYQDKTGRVGGLMVRHGLRVSDYPTDPKTGRPLTKAEVKEYIAADKATGKGHTFYVDTSA